MNRTLVLISKGRTQFSGILHTIITVSGSSTAYQNWVHLKQARRKVGKLVHLSYDSEREQFGIVIQRRKKVIGLFRPVS